MNKLSPTEIRLVARGAEKVVAEYGREGTLYFQFSDKELAKLPVLRSGSMQGDDELIEGED